MKYRFLFLVASIVALPGIAQAQIDLSNTGHGVRNQPNSTIVDANSGDNPPPSQIEAMAFASPDKPVDEAVKLDRYVVSATRTAVDIDDAPGSLSVIGREQIDYRPAGRIGDIIRSVPGIYASSNVLGQGVPSAQGGRFSVRGISGSARTLVLLDNLPLNDPYLGNVNWASLFMDEIQRVEVLPGAGPALYGGNAFAGVVHVITRDPSSREFFLRARYQDGGLAQREGTFLYRDRWSKRLGVSLSYNWTKSDGYHDEMDLVKTASAGAVPVVASAGAQPTVTTVGAPAWIVGNLAPRPWETENAQAKLFFDFDSGAKLKAGVLYFHSDLLFGTPRTSLRDASGQPVFSGTLNLDGKRVVLAERDFLNGPSSDEYTRYYTFFEHNLASRFQLTAGLSFTDRDRNACAPGTAAVRGGGDGSLTVSPTQTQDFYVQIASSFGERQHWVAGLNLNRGETDRSSWMLADWRDMASRTTLVDTAVGCTDNVSLFAQDEVRFNSRVSLFLGGRYDWFRSDGVETVYATSGAVMRTVFPRRTFGQFNPRAALVAKSWTGGTVRASAGRAFRSPSLFDFYVVSRRGTTVTLSNPNLKPESAWNYETSLQQDFGGGATQITVTGFANELEDLIYSKVLSATTRQAINAGRAWSRGAELKLRQRIVEGLHAQISYSYTRSKMVANDADPASVGKELVNAPRHLFNTMLEGRHGRWFGSFGVMFVDDSFDTAANTDVVHGVYGAFSRYWLVNAQLGYEFNRHLEAIASAENLLDREYFQFTREPGRILALSLRLKL